VFGFIKARNVRGGFSEKILVPKILGKLDPKFAQNGPFWIFLDFGSKICFTLGMLLEANIALLSVKTVCSKKVWFWSYKALKS